MTLDECAYAESVKGFLPIAEADGLAEAAFAADISLGPFLEIGSYCGKSACYLGFVAKRVGSVVFCVDHHQGSEENQPGWEYHDASTVDRSLGRMNTFPFFQQTMYEADLEDVVVPILGDSGLVARYWKQPLSFLFIDGGHGDDPTSSDYLSWSPLVAVGGFLAIHDVFDNPAHGGLAPYENIYLPAVESEFFEERSRVGSLRILERVRSVNRSF